MIGSLVAPGLVLSIGIGLLLNFIGVEGRWYTSAVGAQLSWTLPFGVLVMFAVMSRFDRAWEEAAYDLGASRWQTMRLVVIPILAPGMRGGGAVRLHPVLRRIRPHPADRGLAQHAAARNLDA